MMKLLCCQVTILSVLKKISFRTVKMIGHHVSILQTGPFSTASNNGGRLEQGLMSGNKL